MTHTGVHVRTCMMHDRMSACPHMHIACPPPHAVIHIKPRVQLHKGISRGRVSHTIITTKPHHPHEYMLVIRACCMHAPMHHVIGMHAHLVIFACPQQNRNKKVLGGGGKMPHIMEDP